MVWKNGTSLLTEEKIVSGKSSFPPGEAGRDNALQITFLMFFWKFQIDLFKIMHLGGVEIAIRLA